MEESENPWVWVRELRIRDWGIGIGCREEMDDEVDGSNSNSDSGDEVKSSDSTAPSSRLEEETEDAKQRVNLRIREKWQFPSVPRLMEGNTGGQLGKLKDPLQRTAIRRGKTLEYVLDGIGENPSGALEDIPWSFDGSRLSKDEADIDSQAFGEPSNSFNVSGDFRHLGRGSKEWDEGADTGDDPQPQVPDNSTSVGRLLNLKKRKLEEIPGSIVPVVHQKQQLPAFDSQLAGKRTELDEGHSSSKDTAVDTAEQLSDTRRINAIGKQLHRIKSFVTLPLSDMGLNIDRLVRPRLETGFRRMEWTCVSPLYLY